MVKWTRSELCLALLAAASVLQLALMGLRLVGVGP